MLESIRDGESEEFHKNLISDFFKRSQFGQNFINTKGHNDLVIHNGKTADSSVGVILEIKSPANKSEMPHYENLNCKASQELLLYFLRERIGCKNLELRTLIITNVDDWWIFDAAVFEERFLSDRTLVRRFREFQAGSLSGRRTEFFYKEIAAPAIDSVKGELAVCHLRLMDYKPILRSKEKEEERTLISLFKVLSPEHLLKVPFATDNQTLDRGFYAELLHIIGLVEVASSGKRLISRNKPEERYAGSLLENAILQIDALDRLSQVRKPEAYGETRDEQLFALALELVITWIDRIIFLKLLEAQLIRYNGADKSYAFLDETRVASYGDLNALFFAVLARLPVDRSKELQDKYSRVPYLNSSLFDPAPIEHDGVFISALRDDLRLPVFRRTALSDSHGRRVSGQLRGLEYMLRFLEAYDFSGEGGEEIQEENKALISASVLGLIFEKINGYKDGSFFTPGSVTMHICRENVRLAVLDKFNSEYNWRCKDIPSLYDRIEDKTKANELIDGLTICDPAVGSGHFLVSALNEILAVKSDLKILRDRSGRVLRDYEVEVVNDELVVADEDGRFFSYNPNNRNSQNVQEALFHEKQRIIENCLFGVDINRNSVRICRLRLWIELLKSAYYKDDGQGRSLETLPNIDINIKAGDSLIGRFPLDSSLSGILRASKRSVADYRAAIAAYQAAKGREEKRGFEKLIEDIRHDFSAAIQRTLLGNLSGELYGLEHQTTLFAEVGEKATETRRKKQKLAERIKEVKADVASEGLYRRAFEWRFEFPHVLGVDGTFRGFDLVVGNPPYGVPIRGLERSFVEARLGAVPDHEIFYLFLNLGRELLRNGGLLSLIVPNTLLFNVYAERYRLSLLEKWEFEEIVDCTDFRIFADATVRNAILSLRKCSASARPIAFRPTAGARSLEALMNREKREIPGEMLREQARNWALVFRTPPEILAIAARIRRESKKLSTLFPEISQGLIAYDRYQGQSEELIDARAFHSTKQLDSSYKKWLWGEDVRRYQVVWNGKEYIKYGDRGEGIANPRQAKFFKTRRVLVREITSPQIYAGLTEDELYNDPAIINILESKDGELSIWCLLAILNSKFATFYHLHSSPKITKGEFPKILVTDLQKFPLPGRPDKDIADRIAHLARTVHLQKAIEGGPTTDVIEAEVDKLVYEFYGLSVKEVATIEARLAPGVEDEPEDESSQRHAVAPDGRSWQKRC